MDLCYAHHGQMLGVVGARQEGEKEVVKDQLGLLINLAVE